ncbi:MAG: hypothetical protein FJX76_19370 [Armatimonadetes bacterium]|nr:hypothetical protein [Armatimonadota bacterium]
MCNVRVNPRALYLLIGGSLFLHLFLLGAGRTVLQDWRWPHEPLHSLIEGLGAFVTLTIAPLLYTLERPSLTR